MNTMTFHNKIDSTVESLYASKEESKYPIEQRESIRYVSAAQELTMRNGNVMIMKVIEAALIEHCLPLHNSLIDPIIQQLAAKFWSICINYSSSICQCPSCTIKLISVMFLHPCFISFTDFFLKNNFKFTFRKSRFL